MSKRIIKALRRDWQLWLFMLLPLTYVVVLKYVPMLGLQIAFRKFTAKGGVWGSKWVGFDNFVKFFQSFQFWRVVSNTLILSVYSLLFSTLIPVAFALLYNTLEYPRFKKITQTIVNLPHFISVVVLVGILMQVFNSRSGIYGIIVESLTGNYPKDILGEAEAFRHMYVWSGIWQEFGWSSIIYIASLSGVDTALHEAAEIDGASRLQRVWHIDLPHLKPTIMILLIMATGNIMAVGFEKAYLMQNNLNLKYSELISTYVYKIGLSGQTKTDFSYATAIDLFNSVINLILILSTNFISKRISEVGLF